MSANLKRKESHRGQPEPNPGADQAGSRQVGPADARVGPGQPTPTRADDDDQQRAGTLGDLRPGNGDNIWAGGNAGGVAEDDKDGRDHRQAPYPCRRHPGQLGSPAKPFGLTNTVMTGLVTRYLRIKRLPLDSFVDSFAERLVEASGDALRLLRHNPNTGEAR